MNTTKKFLIGFLTLSTGLLASAVFASEEVPAEAVHRCVERTGKTVDECQAMIQQFRSGGGRPMMTVDDCMERTGKTTEECQAIVERFKSGDRGNWGRSRSDDRRNTGDTQSSQGMMGREENRFDGGNQVRSLSDRVEQRRTMQQHMYESIENRIQKLLEYLDSKGIDTAKAKDLLATFTSKANDVLSRFGAYIQTLKTWEGDKSDANRSMVASAKSDLRTTLLDASQYYHQTLMPTLRSLIDSLSN